MMNPAFADVRADVEPLLIAFPVKETDADAVVDDEATELNEDADEDDEEEEDEEDETEDDDDEDVDDTDENEPVADDEPLSR